MPSGTLTAAQSWTADAAISSPLALTAPSRELARVYALESIASSMAEERRQSLLKTLSEREDFLRRGYDYQDVELAATRTLTEKARAGDPRAQRNSPRFGNASAIFSHVATKRLQSCVANPS